MTYQPYLIANYATGVDTRLQPWLIPDDAQEQLFDGFVYRGVMSKRQGYNYLAYGDLGGAPYRESRIVHKLTGVAPTTGTINSSNKTFTFALHTQIARGSLVITGSNPSQVLIDNGLGAFTGPGTGTINYTTGAVSITFTSAPIAASTVTAVYSFMPGNPVMMIANFITATNTKELIVADTQYVNKYNTTTNILEDISPGTAYTGSKFDFFTWVNYEGATDAPRLLFCNNKDVIQQYDGTTVTNYTYNMLTSASVPVAVTTLTCSFMVQMKDRLLLLRTTENGTVYPKRIRISGTGANSDDFRTSATGAGFIDIPDGSWIQGASFNRDDLLIFTQNSTWVLKYTGNDTVPFVIDRIDESRGSDATFGVITYLNRTSAISKRGLIISDGYRVERQDEALPDFSFNQVDGDNFSLCFAGVVDEDRDHYLLYPPSTKTHSLRILTTNYDEDNYCTYRIPLSCMGRFQQSFNITWNDLTNFPNWDSLGAAYGNWYSFAFNKGSPYSVGGGHKGEIWKLNETQGEDNPVRIYNITVIDSETIEVTTDFNNYRKNDETTGFDNEYNDESLSADYIFFTDVGGMLEINNQQFPITQIVSNNVFRVNVNTAGDTSNFGAYTSGGRAQRVIPFSSTFKKFNPYVNQDKKVRCGWLYMYVDSSGTNLQRNIKIDSITQANPCVITTEVNHNLSNGDQVELFDIGGMTELNDTSPYVTVISLNSFSLNGIDSSGFTAYTSGGFVGIPIPAKMNIDIITNDNVKETELNNPPSDPYQGNMTNLTFENGSKKWYKVFINQTGKFIQFRLRNLQAGAKVNVHATMPGFSACGRLI